MKRPWLVPVLILMCSLIASGVLADPTCKKIQAPVGPETMIEEGCSYDGEFYPWCFERGLRGNLRGTWTSYGRGPDSAPLDNGWFLIVPDGLAGNTGWPLFTLWNLAVIQTHKGEIIAQETTVVDIQSFFVDEYGTFSSTMRIIGGTGGYEGATGWLGAVTTIGEGGAIRGLICTPGG
jgi:hypothetical protein